MKLNPFIPILILLTLYAACNNPEPKTVSDQKSKFDCHTLADKKAVCNIAQSILDSGDREHIWNLSAIDTSEYFTTEDYFTNTATKNRLVLIGGTAGMSAGTARNLLILFACSDTLSIVWAGQTGPFTQSDIKDLDNDGIKEIVSATDWIWMGECGGSHYIYNFKNGEPHSLYEAKSMSFIDCGRESLTPTFKEGDTLADQINYTLQQQDRLYVVQQIRTVKVHNGGETDEQIVKNLTITTDTAIVTLK
ncbi:MAG: hypothetical protein J7621_21340 [Niastella sp.]|nr:hypothetical protein [Niastella sp.]